MTLLLKTITTFLFLLFFFFIFTSPSTAEIKSINIRSDYRPMILFQNFGFTQTGNTNITISSVSVTSTLSQPNASLFGFFLLSQDSLNNVLLEFAQNPYLCVLRSKYISLLFTFQSLSPYPHASFQLSYPVTDSNMYSLFFANCNPESLVTMDVRTELFNTDHDKVTKNYLSVGLTQLPSLYFIFALVYLFLSGFWIFVCFENKRSVHWLHLLMSVLLIIKALSLLCDALDKRYVNVTGTSHGWNVLLYIFQFINSVLLYTVIVLIGSGWSYLKPNLVGKEKKVLMIVIVFQVLANVASVVIGETGPFIINWVMWNQLFLLADFVCFCAVIFPIVWSIRSFSKTDKKAAGSLTVYRLFCILVIGYLLVAKIGVFVLKTMVVYKHQWACSAAKEIVSFVFYLLMFYMFRPVAESDYIVVDAKGEYEEAPKMVKG